MTYITAPRDLAYNLRVMLREWSALRIRWPSDRMLIGEEHRPLYS
jgi:hypothetical protein